MEGNEKYGLPEDFRLTDYTELKGWGCKVPQATLLKLLEEIKGPHKISMDCSVIPLRNDLFLISTTDVHPYFFSISLTNWQKLNYSHFIPVFLSTDQQYVA